MPQRDAKRYAIYRNGVLNTDLEALHMQESAGSERADIASLLYPTQTLEGREFHSQVVCDEIEILDPDTDEVVHWGKIGMVPTTLTDSGEALTVVSRAERFHYGGQVGGIWVWNPIQPPIDEDDEVPGGPEIISNTELVFNPIIDGKVNGNLNSNFLSSGDPLVDDSGHPLFINPESVRTKPARDLQGANAITWPLSMAVYYLLRTLNADETYVTNPTLETLLEAFDDEEDLVTNTAIPHGTFLADALDMLIVPLGYRWKMNRTAIGSRTFEFYGRNDGDIVGVRHQALDSTLDLGQTNVAGSNITFDVSRLANEITIVGGPATYEVSVELHRAWPASQDDLDESQYANTAEDFTTVKDAYRKWVLNEAGDYTGMREEIDGVFTTLFREAMEAEFTSAIWNEFVPKRRKFEPTLTLSDDGTPIGKAHGIEIEYYNGEYDPEHPENAPEWLPLEGAGAMILEQECGIYFAGEFPPLEEAYGVTTRDDIGIRVTASIVSDKRLGWRAIRDEDSPQQDVAPMLIDAPTKFRAATVTPLSKYHGKGKPSNAADDLAKITDFTERVRSVWDLMDVGGVIQLDGLDRTDGGTQYKIGQRVSGIAGKNLSFRAKTDVEEYPQIVAIERDVQKQTMNLHLQRFNQAINFGDGKRASERRSRRA